MSIYQRNGKWWIGYRHPQTGKWTRNVGGTTRARAERALAEVRADVAAAPIPLPIVEPTVRFAEFVEVYVASAREEKKKSWESEAGILHRLNREFGSLALNDITSFMIQQHKLRRSQVLVPKTNRLITPRTVNYDLAVLKALFNMAIRLGQAKANPVRQVKFFKLNNERRRYLSQREVQALLEVCTDRLAHLKPVLVMALNTGMRMGEILGLRWADIDFPNGYIHLRTSKNGRGRSISMNEGVSAALQGLVSYTPGDSRSESFVFCNGQGKHRTSIRNAFLTALERAGIKDFHFHDLRHTFASHLVSAGEDIMVIKELLGHETLQMTMRYAHLHPERGRRAVARLGGLYGTETAPEDDLPKANSREA